MQDPDYVKNAFAEIADRYVVTNHVLSAGIDVLWRRKVGRIVAARAPERILDVATGTGDLALELARRCPAAEVVGTDFCAPMLEVAQQRGLRSVVEADALALPFTAGEFDVVTVAFGLRNMVDWAAALREMRRVTRPGGLLLVLDFSLPRFRPLRGAYRLYLHKVLPRVAGAITGKREAYEYLGGTIEGFPSGAQMVALIESCGYVGGQAKALSGGIASIYTAEAA